MEKNNGNNPHDDNVHNWQFQEAQWEEHPEEKRVVAIAGYLAVYEANYILKIWPPTFREMGLIRAELDTFADEFNIIDKDYFIDSFRIFCTENLWPGNYGNFIIFSERYQELAIHDDRLDEDEADELSDSGVCSENSSYTEDP